MAKNYGSTDLMNFKAAEERRKARLSDKNNLMAGSNRVTESKKYNMPANIGIAKGKRDFGSMVSAGMRDYTAGKTANAKSMMTKAEGKAKEGKKELEKFTRKGQSNKMKPKQSLLKKFKSSKTLAEFVSKVKNK